MTMLREEQAQHVISALENAGIEADAVHRAGEEEEDGHTVVGCLSANRETGDLVCVCVYFNDPFTGELFDEYKVSDASDLPEWTAISQG